MDPQRLHKKKDRKDRYSPKRPLIWELWSQIWIKRQVYTKVVGMTEVQGFSAPANVATSFGLTNKQPVVVRKFVMADVKDAPSLKLMSFPNVKIAKWISSLFIRLLVLVTSRCLSAIWMLQLSEPKSKS